MIYYEHGLQELERYYREFQPKDIFERHFVSPIVSVSKKSDLELPWHFGSNKQIKGEKGLSIEEGKQGYGPVSQKKLHLEQKRLDDLKESMKKVGYSLSLAGGLPRGYFLIDKNGNYVFIIVGGQHRVATMVYLGYKSINVSFQPNYPRLIKESELCNWPLVRNGKMKEYDALKIFKSYFRDESISVFDMLIELKNNTY